MDVLGYARKDGKTGIRNYVIVLPTVACVNGIANGIAQRLPEIKALTHGHGCGRMGNDAKNHIRTLVGIGKNPNVAGVLVLGLGCEIIKAKEVAEAIRESGKPVDVLIAQEEGGTYQTIEKAIPILQQMLKQAAQAERIPVKLSEIILGLECGGSDALSGVTANTAIGYASDWIVDQGGTVILTEATEMIGTAHILRRRARTPELGERIEQFVDFHEKRANEKLGEVAKVIISPGNMDGGMSTIREKSLGCIIKGGTTTINELLEYGQCPSEKGLVIMDGPGYDVESLTGLAVAGAQVMIFSTGRGTPFGFPVVPVIKVASNSSLYASMPDDMDINAGVLLEGTTLGELGKLVIGKIMETIAGEPTCAEASQVDSAIYPYVTDLSF